MGSDQVSMTPTFYDVSRVAEMFRMSRMTVYRAIHTGELPAVRIRGRWLVPAKVIDALVDAAVSSNTTSPATAGHDGGASR